MVLSKADMVDQLGFRPDRVAVVPPGIHPRFAPGEEDEDLMGPSGRQLDEVIDERPSDRYLTDILYPVRTEVGPEQERFVEVFGREVLPRLR